MSNYTPKVIILVLNWNGWRDTLDCLESLYRNDYPDYQVVLLDNNSTDDSLVRIQEWAAGKTVEEHNSGASPFTLSPLPYIVYERYTAEHGGLAEEEARLHGKLPSAIPHPLIIIRTGENLGFAGGNNVGLRYSQQRKADYILLLNNDAVLRSRHTLTTMIEFMETDQDAGACGGRLFYPDGSPQISYGNFPSLPRTLAFLFPAYKLLPKGLFSNVKRANVVPDEAIRDPLPVDYPSGACFLVRNETINDVGLLDEQFFMYTEETDWCLRMMKRGWGRYYLPTAEVVHKYAGSFIGSKMKINSYFTDSIFKYYRKNFSIHHLWIVAAGYLVRSLYSLSRWTITAYFTSESLRLPALNQAKQWRFSLKLAVTAMKDLLNGKISRAEGQDQTRVTW